MRPATTYDAAGVRATDDALAAVERYLAPTLRSADVLCAFGHYAAVLRVAPDLALAVCTDGVGSKTTVAAELGRLDTIGFDLVAMNVNDVLCVGARPLALVDYLGVNRLDTARAEQILRGLGAAAQVAGVAVPGGEIAQLPGIIGARGGDESGDFDLVGTCVGTLHPDDIVTGDRIRPGDALVGLRSSGIHSNGLTLARRALLDARGLRLDRHVPELGRALGDELLEPTLIYVAPVLALWDAGIPTHGLAHITGDGLANLTRLNRALGFVVDALPRPPAVFELIQRAGGISTEEMFAVFNMGVGFVVVVPAERAEDACRVMAASGFECAPIGHVDDRAGSVRVPGSGVELGAAV